MWHRIFLPLCMIYRFRCPPYTITTNLYPAVNFYLPINRSIVPTIISRPPVTPFPQSIAEDLLLEIEEMELLIENRTANALKTLVKFIKNGTILDQTADRTFVAWKILRDFQGGAALRHAQEVLLHGETDETEHYESLAEILARLHEPHEFEEIEKPGMWKKVVSLFAKK